MFDKITIIGCGLIGSSLLRIIDKKKLSKQINVFDKSKECSEFIKNNFEAKVFKNIAESVKGSDLIIISSPLSSYKEILLYFLNFPKTPSIRLIVDSPFDFLKM